METVWLRREYRPADEDFLNVTLIVECAEFPDERSPVANTALKHFLVAMRRVRPDLMEWLVTPDGKAKGAFSKQDMEYGWALYRAYVRWRMQQPLDTPPAIGQKGT